MYDIQDFHLSHLIECGSALRRLRLNATSMEHAADGIVRHLYEHFGDPATETRACPLVRMFVTLPFCRLDEPTCEWLRRRSGGQAISADSLILALLASAGDRPEWNDRLDSARHRAILLQSPSTATEYPMAYHVIRQLGLNLEEMPRLESEALLQLERQSHLVFHVFDALGSPYVPAQQDFVVPCRIRSVLGIGGLLSTGSFFQLLLFSRSPVDRDTADLLRMVVLNIKVVLLSVLDRPIFEP